MMPVQPNSDPSSRRPEQGRSFGRVAEAYERGRPTYPREAIAWLLGDEPLSVLELGAGTGKLTEVLLELGHEVFATDPDDAMLDVLSAKCPDTRATVGTAEQIPAGDGLYDVVVTGQAYHWFDLERALPEITRVLRPGGKLAIVWNERDERIPWVRKLGRVMGGSSAHDDPTKALDDTALFSAVESREFRHWQVVDRETVQDLALSVSDVAVLDEAGRERKRTEVLAFYDDYGRGMDGMQLPYTCRCFRTQVLPHAQVHTQPKETVAVAEPEPTLGEEQIALTRPTDTAERLPRVLTGPDDDTGTILIDFR